jgi:hypothetical protein
MKYNTTKRKMKKRNNADDESDAENGSDIEVPFVSDDEVDDNDLTVTEDDDQIEDADTVIWSEVEQNLNIEEFRERTGPQDMLPMDTMFIYIVCTLTHHMNIHRYYTLFISHSIFLF